VKSAEEVVQWARDWADELEEETVGPQRDGFGNLWKAEPADAENRIKARITTALEFLRQYANDSTWLLNAKALEDGRLIPDAARGISPILRAWADQAATGIIPIPALSAMEARVIASTDIMDQVRALNADKTVHPAAPIVLAGAALETALREAVDEKQLTLNEKPSITAYARLLRTNNLLNKQDLKDVEQMAGMRNEAAHGEFDTLSRERAGLMEQQVNLFLARLAAALGD
jgi:hypothetical protein